MDLHPYDGIERRFRHTDSDRNAGLDVVSRVLKLPKPWSNEGILYDLSFYSGGIGVLDNLAITIPFDQTIWSSLVAALKAKTPEDVSNVPEWADDFIWLLTGEEKSVPPREAAVQFINSERYEFQSECYSTNCILFADGSDVNYWTALWCDGTKINYRGYDQG
jgi:hypothetical protein